MKFIMFKDQWIDPILLGTKVQTVRPPRKIPIAVGDALSLRVWTGRPYASKQRTLLETHCTSVCEIAIDYGGIVKEPDKKFGQRMGSRLSVEDGERFARRDGFANFAEMCVFFGKMHGLPFRGVAISWN